MGHVEPDQQRKWDERHRATTGMPAAAPVLADHLHLLPRHGRALDLACGLGANALLLARCGLEVSAWDLSPVAVERLRAAAAGAGLSVRAEVRDVLAAPPAPESFHVIVVSRFLERALVPALCAALRPDGLLFYQTFIRDKVAEVGPSNPDYLLAENELLHLFVPPLALRVYREEGRVGDTSRGFRNEAMLVAQKKERP